MDIKTISELIEWSRSLHAKLAQCLTHCASRHPDERTSMLLGYLASHEVELERMVAEFNQQADPKAGHTYIYDYIPHKPINTHLACDDHYTRMDAGSIRTEVFGFHDEIIRLYRTLIDRAAIPEVTDLLQPLLDMEVHETKRLVRQVERMADL